MKEELLKSLKENHTLEESDFNIKSIKHYNEIIKAVNKDTIKHESIQGQMLKKSIKIVNDLLKT